MHTYSTSAVDQRRDALMAEADSGRLAQLQIEPGKPARRRLAGLLVEIGYFVVNAGIRLDRSRAHVD
ncbi:MAG TPA: hypothetical protein VKT51_08625 [Candidatus Eremiobacteraceae bacterium]|nr:hypothetical protein [Candidatus Eremiobacteraceae bacterium]